MAELEKAEVDMELLQNEQSSTEENRNKTTSLTLPTSFLTRKDRLEVIFQGILRRLIEDTGIPMEPEIKKFKARSMEQHLTNALIPPDRYEEVYNKSFQIYVESGFGKGPWNVFYMLEAWKRIQAAESAKLKNPGFDTYEQEKLVQAARNARASCATCKGMGLTIEDGKVVYDEQDGVFFPRPCTDCSED